MSRLKYRLDLQETAVSTGYFAPIPREPTQLTEGLAYLHACPNDAFMHTHVLGLIGALDVDAAMGLLDADAARDPILRALLLEAALVVGHLAPIKKRFTPREIKTLDQATPLVFLRSEGLADQSLHSNGRPCSMPTWSATAPCRLRKRSAWPFQSRVSTAATHRLRMRPT